MDTAEIQMSWAFFAGKYYFSVFHSNLKYINLVLLIKLDSFIETLSDISLLIKEEIICEDY